MPPSGEVAVTVTMAFEPEAFACGVIVKVRFAPVPPKDIPVELTRELLEEVAATVEDGSPRVSESGEVELSSSIVMSEKRLMEGGGARVLSFMPTWSGKYSSKAEASSAAKAARDSLESLTPVKLHSIWIALIVPVFGLMVP